MKFIPDDKLGIDGLGGKSVKMVGKYAHEDTTILSKIHQGQGSDFANLAACYLDLHTRHANLLELVRALHNECLASDFNEHWESYTNLFDLLEEERKRTP